MSSLEERLEKMEALAEQDRSFHAEIRADLKTSLDNQQRIEGQLRQMNGTLRDVVVEIGGAPGQLGRDPGRHSIRVRLHQLESSKHAAVAVNAALGLIFGRVSRAIIVAGALAALVLTVATLARLVF